MAGLFDYFADSPLIKEPRQYSNPTGRADPTVPVESSSGFDWNALGSGILAGGAAGRGDIRGALAVIDRPNEERRRDKLLQLQEERLKLDKLQTVPSLIATLSRVSEMVSDPAAAKQIAGVVKPLFKEVAGVEWDDEFISSFILDNSKGEIVAKMYPELAKLKPQELLRLANNPKMLEQAISMQREKMGKEAIEEYDKIVAGGGIKEGADQKEVVKALDSLIPGWKFVTDEQKLQRGLPTKSVMEAEAKAKIEQKPTDVGDEREALAQELGFKRFSELPPEKKKEINAEIKRRSDEKEALARDREGRLAGQFAQSIGMQEKRLALQEEQQRRLLPSQQKTLTSNKVAMETIDEFSSAYEDFIKESGGGPLSDMIRGGIAKNMNAQRAQDLVTVSGRTPAEKKLAARYNAIIGNIRNLTDEVGVLTDIDANRILGSFNPAQDKEQVRANLQARRQSHERTYNAQIQDYQAMGKDVSGFVKQGVTKPKQGGDGGVMRNKSKSGKPIISRDGGKTWEYE